jgi:hypothetical protein
VANPKGYSASHVKLADTIYIALVKKAGLYGKAFFAHNMTVQEKKQLKRLWYQAQKEAVKQLGEQE